MNRKEETDRMKKKHTMKQQAFDYTYDVEISILLPYVKLMPTSIRSKFIIPLRQIVEKQIISQLNRQTIEKLYLNCQFDSTDPTKNFELLQLFCRFLKLSKLRDQFLNYSKKPNAKQKSQENSNDSLGVPFVPFEPSVQKQSTKFQPIQFTINPNYENIIKMYKTFTDVHMNMEYKIKQINQAYTFFSPPRFISKVLEMRDFQSSFSQKGNIIMLGFQGNKIIGKRGFAFSNSNIIYWWEKNYKDYKEILPELAEDKQKDQKDKNKRKQGQQSKNQQVDHSNLTENFKLTFKLVGHHGKITSMSLSDDQYYLISTATDKVIKLWCLRQKSLLAQYRGHMKTIWSVSFSKSGYFFLSGSADKTIKLWSTDDSIARRVFVGHTQDVTKVDFMKNPDLIVSSSDDKTIRIWNTLTTQCINTLKFDKTIINFRLSISGRYFSVCDQSGKISFFDLLKGEMISCFKVPQKQQLDRKQTKYLKIHDICFSLDEKQFTCVSSKYIIIYSVDKIYEKQSKSIFAESGRNSSERIVAAKEVINTGRDSNLVYCQYHDKGVLVVASTLTKKY